MMKKVILMAGLLICGMAMHLVFGQPSEGVILYEVKVNLHRRLPPERAEMKNMMPEYDVHQQQLFFNVRESLYKPVEEEEDDAFESEGPGVRMRMRRPSAIFYFNNETSKRVTQQELMGKKYLIQDSVNILPWKLGSAVKVIHGYSCKQASYYNEQRKENLVAWYTDALRPFLGPEHFNSLPGAVLEVDVNEGERIITARKIELRPLKKNEIKVPTAGQNITGEAFRKMMDEEMQRRRQEGGVMMMRN